MNQNSGNRPVNYSLVASLLTLILCVSHTPAADSAGANPQRGATRITTQLDSWGAQRIATRPGLPQRGKQESGRAATRRAVDPAGILPGLLKRFTAFPVSSTGLPKPVLREGNEEDQVWSVVLSQEPGEGLHEFAAHLRPDDARPLYWHATGLPERPDATFAQASQFVTDAILRKETGAVRVTGFPKPVHAAQARIRNQRWQCRQL